MRPEWCLSRWFILAESHNGQGAFPGQGRVGASLSLAEGRAGALGAGVANTPAETVNNSRSITLIGVLEKESRLWE